MGKFNNTATHMHIYLYIKYIIKFSNLFKVTIYSSLLSLSHFRERISNYILFIYIYGFPSM